MEPVKYDKPILKCQSIFSISSLVVTISSLLFSYLRSHVTGENFQLYHNDTYLKYNYRKRLGQTSKDDKIIFISERGTEPRIEKVYFKL